MKLLKHHILFFLLSIFLFSCEKIETVDDVSGDGENTAAVKSLSVKPMTADASSLPYPITIYAFDNNGKNKTVVTIKDGVSREEPLLKLSRGQYTIIALHTPETYPAQDSYATSSAAVKLPADNYAKEPLYFGATEVNLTANNQTADIRLNLKQVMLNISLSDVPTDVNKVTVRVNAPYTKMTLLGNYSGEQDITIPCYKTEKGWTTGDVYILPSHDKPTFTFDMKNSNGNTTSYSYTYNGTLNAGTPYKFEGAYTDSDIPDQLSLYTDFTVGTWGAGTLKSFTFGPAATVQETGSDVVVTDFPEDGEIWDGHVVALADNYGATCELMLISLKEWSEVYASTNTSHSNDAAYIAANYKEGGVTGWTIPTEDDAAFLKSVYKYESNFDILNYVLEQCSGTPLSMKDGTSNVRYLCEGAQKAFGFSSSSTLGSAGASTKYRLRLVRHLTLRK